MDELSYLSRPASRSPSTLLGDLHGLNQQFLALVLQADTPDTSAGLDDCIRETLRSLNETQLERLATCPYSLFDVSFSDAPTWRHELSMEHTQIDTRLDVISPAAGAFVLATLLYTRQLCQNHDDMARLLLGMTEDVVRLLAAPSLSALTSCAFSGHPPLTARLAEHAHFWSDLIDFVRDGTRERHLAAHTLGVQHSAAKF